LPSSRTSRTSGVIASTRASAPSREKAFATAARGVQNAVRQDIGLATAPHSSRSSIRQREDGAGCGDTAQRVFAERHQRRGGLGGDGTRDQHRPAERPAQPLQPADQIDRRADGGEVQPVGRPNIAPQYLAEMQRRAEGQRRQPLRLPHRIEAGHAGTRGADRAQRRIAGIGRRAGDREDRQHAVAEISREAGLTQGALYSQFKSKEALAKEAACKALADGAASWRELREVVPDPLSAYLDAYLCESHIKRTGSGCLIAANVSEVARLDETIGTAFADGFRDLVALIENAFPEGTPKQVVRRRALTLMSAMVGSVAMARALQKTDSKLSQGNYRGCQDRTGASCDG
jgi:TetR/AcrR family transcriptional repressor of nem operon